MAASPDPKYDFRTALYAFAPGVLLTRDLEAALGAQYVANAYTPLTQAQVLAIAGPLPAFPTKLPRFPDSNAASDGWTIAQRGGALG